MSLADFLDPELQYYGANRLLRTGGDVIKLPVPSSIHQLSTCMWGGYLESLLKRRLNPINSKLTHIEDSPSGFLVRPFLKALLPNEFLALLGCMEENKIPTTVFGLIRSQKDYVAFSNLDLQVLRPVSHESIMLQISTRDLSAGTFGYNTVPEILKEREFGK